MSGLSQRVQRILGPLPPHAARALDAVEPGSFLPRPMAPLAGADAPVPFLRGTGDVALTPSPRVLGLLLQLLEVGGGERVLLVGAESGHLAALLVEAGAARARIVEPDRECASAAQGFLEAAGYGDRVEVRAGPPAKEAEGAQWDRVLLHDPRRTLTPGLSKKLGELGFALAVEHTSEGFEVVKTVRCGDELGELRAVNLPVKPGLPENPGTLLDAASRRSVRGLLALEEMAGNAWRGIVRGGLEGELRRGVEDTWRRDPGELAALAPEEAAQRELAKTAFHLGYLYQAAGDTANAADLYARSHGILPGAEALTFLGWVRSFEGRLQEAIECCHRAIAADPTLGNPYNDIGAYLLQMDRAREAVGWLERALHAPRYEAPFFPHLNLARAYIVLGEPDKARGHLRAALELNPHYAPALEMLRRLQS